MRLDTEIGRATEAVASPLRRFTPEMMSEATARRLSELAKKASAGARKVSPIELAAQVVEDSGDEFVKSAEQYRSTWGRLVRSGGVARKGFLQHS